MHLVHPSPSGTVAAARAEIAAARAAASSVVAEPVTFQDRRTMGRLLSGIDSATRAATELLIATPTSELQDLVAARQRVLDGAGLLAQAISLHGSAFGLDHATEVKALAGQADSSFSDALDLLGSE